MAEPRTNFPRMRLSFYLSLLILLNTCATAQPGKTGFSKKETAQLAKARAALDAQRYGEAVADLTTLIERQAGNDQLYFLRSLAHKGQYNYAAAAEDIRKGISLVTKPAGRPFAELGSVLSLAGDFPGALRAYQRYYDYQMENGRSDTQLQKATDLLTRATTADSIARSPVAFKPSPVPGAINSKESFEYHPTVSTDGNKLVFTRRVSKRQEDFYFSERGTDGQWSSAQPLPGINTEYDEGAQTISADGRYMVYTSCNQPGARPGCDLYETSWDGEQFAAGEAITSPGINTEFYESQPSLSADGRFLVFSSKRPGGKGGGDLYISARLPDGGWSRPGPLASLNTAGDEQYPFWAADGRSLYFTSNGLPGLGGDDLFFTVLGGDNQFSSPKNLGFPINTAENETNMFIPLDASVAYFSKRYYDAETQAIQIDLWQFPLPRHLRPRPATYVNARVIDRATKAPLSAEITIQSFAEGALPRVQSTDEEGRLITVLPAGQEYAFTVDKPGYLFQSERLTVAAGRTLDDPFEVTIALDKVSSVAEVGTTEEDGSIAFKNVLFSSGSAELLPVSFTELDRLATLLATNPGWGVSLAGHTDDVGDEAANFALSKHRAESVKAYLVTRAGIAAERISTEGFGETKPVATNDTAQGRSQNRRTTFRLVR